jgi:release factor glutamine methyltransferase
VLIPRQETELLVEHVLAATGGRGVVADVGTGSGCIALALASEGKFERVIATDISPDSQAVARMNAELLQGVRTPVEIRGGDLLTPLSATDRITAIVSNPPYIAAQEMPDLPDSVRKFEPHLALVSENDGLEHTLRIIDEAPRVLHGGGLLALEVDSRRAQRVASALRDHSAFCEVNVHNDFTGRERYVLARAR